MGVPYTGSYEMFGATTTESIAGGVEAGGGTITGITEFSGSTSSLISASYISKFDELSIRGARTISDINQSLQYRGYPLDDCLISCSFVEVELENVEINFKTDFLSDIASGSVESNSTSSIDFVRVDTVEGASVSATASAFQNSIFLGWSSTPISLAGSFLIFGRNLQNALLSLNTISTSFTSSFTIPNVDDPTQVINYYAIFDSNVTKRTYCYNYNDNLNDICFRCNRKIDVYFNKTSFSGSSPTNLTWYLDNNLSSNALDGYYYLSGSLNPTVYNVTSGNATYYHNCDGETIVCS
jgi:hypothetical protein